MRLQSVVKNINFVLVRSMLTMKLALGAGFILLESSNNLRKTLYLNSAMENVSHNSFPLFQKIIYLGIRHFYFNRSRDYEKTNV